MSNNIPDLIEEAVIQTSGVNGVAEVSPLIEQANEDSLALVLESLPIEERLALWETIPNRKKLDVLIEMRSDPREVLIRSTEKQHWDTLFLDIDAEDLLELADSLPSELVERAYEIMDERQRAYFTKANEYPEDQVGHWMSHDFLVLPVNAKIRDLARLLRRRVPKHTDTVFLINRSGYFVGAVNLFDVYGLPEHEHLADYLQKELLAVSATQLCPVAAKQVQLSGFAALPAVDEQQKLIGRLDVTTSAELTFEYYERQLMASAGMDENEDLFSPVKKSAQNRAIWLGINLLTAFLASAFIGMFEATLQQVVALAVLMPIVASMGGIAGSQTLTLIVRGLALKQVTAVNLKALVIKELKVGGLNGVIWSIVISGLVIAWFGEPLIGLVIAIAIFVNIITAAVSGVFLPVLLDKLKIDPALSGSVILTTVTDIVGFVAFLGLGTLLLV